MAYSYFLEGQPFDASKFSVTVIYTDGSKEELTGVNVQLDSKANGIVSNGAVITADAGTNSKGGVFTAKGNVVAYAIDSLSVTAPASIKTSQTAKDTTLNDVKASDFTVVANYRDSEGAAQTLTLGPGADYTVDVKLDQEFTDKKTTGTARASVSLTFGCNKTPNGNQVTGISTTYSENVTPGDYSDYEWSGKVVCAQVPASLTAKYFTSGEFAGTALETAEKYGTAPETTGAVKVQKEDYPKKIEAVWKDGNQPSAVDVVLDKDSFTFTVTWASNKTYSEENSAPDVSYSVSPSKTTVGLNKIVITWNCNGVSGTATGINDFTI